VQGVVPEAEQNDAQQTGEHRLEPAHPAALQGEQRERDHAGGEGDLCVRYELARPGVQPMCGRLCSPEHIVASIRVIG